jgi:hypothetical protein
MIVLTNTNVLDKHGPFLDHDGGYLIDSSMEARGFPGNEKVWTLWSLGGLLKRASPGLHTSKKGPGGYDNAGHVGVKHTYRIEPVCAACGARGDNIRRNADTVFNPVTEEWEVVDLFDSTTCEKCEGECGYTFEVIDPELHIRDLYMEKVFDLLQPYGMNLRNPVVDGLATLHASNRFGELTAQEFVDLYTKQHGFSEEK